MDGQALLIRGQSNAQTGVSRHQPKASGYANVGRGKLDKEEELRQALREIRQAITEYKQVCDMGRVGPLDRKKDDKCYPPTLEVLVDGIQPPNGEERIRFLQRIPVDPMTGEQDWGLRSLQDEQDSQTWGGQNVFNVYSKSHGVASDGTQYRDW
jgi:general secretion pathway protein G